MAVKNATCSFSLRQYHKAMAFECTFSRVSRNSQPKRMRRSINIRPDRAMIVDYATDRDHHNNSRLRNERQWPRAGRTPAMLIADRLGSGYDLSREPLYVC